MTTKTQKSSIMTNSMPSSHAKPQDAKDAPEPMVCPMNHTRA